MPSRIQATRPWYPRIYPQRQAAAARAPAGRRGAIAPGAIDTSSTGNIGGDLAKAISNTIQANRQNAIANQLMNTAQPPRAAWVGGTAPTAGVPTAGTAPITGGAGELAMRQQMEQQGLADQLQRTKLAMYQQKLQPDQTAAQIKQAQLALLQARTQKLGEPGKPGKYEPGSSTPQDASYYDFNHQRTDFDAQHGKGSYDRLLAASGYLTQDPNTGNWAVSANAPKDKDGNPLISVDNKGSVTLAPQGAYPGASIPRDAIQSNMARYDATLNRQGQTPRFLGTGGYMQSQNPQSGIAGGDQANPYVPKNTTDLQAIPDGQWFVSPRDNKVYQKQGSQPQQPQKTTQVDTGDQGAQLAGPNIANQPAPDLTGPNLPNQPPQLAGLTPSSTPGSFDLGTLPLGGVSQDTSLADAIRQAQVGNQLQGIA